MERNFQQLERHDDAGSHLCQPLTGCPMLQAASIVIAAAVQP